MTKKKATDGIENINPVLEKFIVPLSKLIPDPANERKHDRKNIDSIKGSWSQFGQQTPIVYDPKTWNILKGNGSYIACKEMGWEKVAAIPTNLESAIEKAGYRVADNRTSELAEWDMDALATTLRAMTDDGFDFKFMFSDDELSFYDGGWESDHDKVADTKENRDGIIDIIKIICPQGTKAQVKELIEPVLAKVKGCHIEQ